MAELADSKFWLPLEFLEDDMLVEEQDEEEKNKKKKKNHKMESDGEGVQFPSEFPYFYESNQGSPVEPVADMESTDDEEQRQHVADLRHQTGRTLLCSAFAACDQKASMAGSLQSILPMRRMSISSQGRSDGSCQVSSLLSPLELQSNHNWGLLHDAAGQVDRLKRQEETGENGSYSTRRLLGPPKGTTAAAAVVAAASTTGYHSKPVIPRHQLQVTHFKELKQQQLPKQRQQCSAGWVRQVKGRRWPGFGQGIATDRPWYSQQQFQMGSGMTAVFLGGGAKESGTGVFLPRTVGGGPSEMRRKPACSTVLLPARVVQALNLDLDEIGTHLSHPGGLVSDYDGTTRSRSTAMVLQKRQQRQQILRSRQAITESRLPPDWTY